MTLYGTYAFVLSSSLNAGINSYFTYSAKFQGNRFIAWHVSLHFQPDAPKRVPVVQNPQRPVPTYPQQGLGMLNAPQRLQRPVSQSHHTNSKTQLDQNTQCFQPQTQPASTHVTSKTESAEAAGPLKEKSKL